MTTKKELYTTFLAKSFAKDVDGSSATWSETDGADVNPLNRDPNYLSTKELQGNAWNQVLMTHSMRYNRDCAHIDVHGRSNPDVRGDPSDCDIGLMPMVQLGDRALAERLRARLDLELDALLRERGFIVNSNPRLHGFWGAGERWTMSMQGVQHGIRSIQVELSLRLRKALFQDKVFRSQFAHVLHRALGSYPQRYVVGDSGIGGIIVRQDMSMSSKPLPDALAKDAIIEELAMVGEVLHYAKISGIGPNQGWVSVNVNDEQMLKKLGNDIEQRFPTQASHSEEF